MAKKLFRTGLIGYPLHHSLSPILHGAMYSSMGIEGEYRLFQIAPSPSGESYLLDLLKQVRTGELYGLNVTIPFKNKIIKYLDGLTQLSEEIGAVNTIYRENNRLMGDNTDVDGFITDVKKVADKPIERALVLGAGGAARAVVYGLLKNKSNILISSRRLEQSSSLAENMRSVLGVKDDQIIAISYSVEEIAYCCSQLDLIVNATPVGMTPDISSSPWLPGVPFPKHAMVYDLIYNPAETKLTSDAKEEGLVAYTGMGMLIEQAALAFERWTGRKPSREIVTQIIKESQWH